VDFSLDKKGITTNELIIGILMLLILSGFVSPAVAFENSQLQWTTGISGKLQRNEALSYMGYSVKAVVFPPPVESDRYKEVPVESVATYVGLEISKKGVFQETVMLGPFESYIVPGGEIKITVKELPLGSATEWLFESYSPWVIVEIESRGIPGLEISITADKDDYSPYSEIPVTVTLNNKGEADAVNVDMDIQTGLPILRGNLKYHYERIGKGASITETITFTAPAHEEREIYNIAANVSSYDVKGTQYSAKAIKSISVSVISVECLSFRKSTVQKIYLKDLAVVSLSVKNSGTCDLKNVTITDSVPANIKLLGNHSLKWITDFPPSAEWDYTYLIKPEEPNKDGFILPAASAIYRLRGEVYNIQSNQPKIIVYGPKIVLSKQADVSSVVTGDTVKVTVTAQNTGSTPTKVTIFDNISGETTLISEIKAYGNSNEAYEKISFGYTYRVAKCTESVKGISAYETFLESAKSYTHWVPECTEYVNGIAAYEDFLEANTKISFSYNLKVNSNESFKIPAASAQYFELGNIGKKIYTQAQGLDITIIHPEDQIVEETPEETPAPVPTETQAPPQDEAQDIIMNRSAGEKIMRNNTFFLSYLWNRSDIIFLNKSVREAGEGSGIKIRLNYSLDISNVSAVLGNSTIARFFNYVKETLSGLRNETGVNQSENVSIDSALPEKNETSGNETEGNSMIARFFNYVKETLSGLRNETGVNQSENVSVDSALPEKNETSGNETLGNETLGNETDVSSSYDKNLIYAISYITLFLTSSLVLYLFFKLWKESKEKQA
jgi:hypothetical protein